MTIDNVTPLPGIPELAQLLHDAKVQTVLVAYLDEEGGWGYARFSKYNSIDEAEIGATHILQEGISNQRLREYADE